MSVEEQHGVVVITRSEVAFASILDVIQSTEAVLKYIESLSKMALLIDLRRALGRNDPSFESIIAPFGHRVVAPFRKSAVVVKSATGRLQLERQLRADKSEALVFTSLEAAMAYLGSA